MLFAQDTAMLSAYFSARRPGASRILRTRSLDPQPLDVWVRSLVHAVHKPTWPLDDFSKWTRLGIFKDSSDPRGGKVTLYEKDKVVRGVHSAYKQSPMASSRDGRRILKLGNRQGHFTEEGIQGHNGILIPRLDEKERMSRTEEQELATSVLAKLNAVSILGDAAFAKSVVEHVTRSNKMAHALHIRGAKSAAKANQREAPACVGSIKDDVPLDWASLSAPKGKAILVSGWGPFLEPLADIFKGLRGSQLCSQVPTVAELRAFGYLQKIIQMEKKKRTERTQKAVDATGKSLDQVDQLMSQETQQSLFEILKEPRSMLADYIWTHHGKFWSAAKWNRLDELELYFRHLHVDCAGVKREGPGRLLNRLDREVKEKAAQDFPDAEFLHLKPLRGTVMMTQEDPLLTLQVLKSPRQIAEAGLKLRNCAANRIERVRRKKSIICVLEENQIRRLVGMAEYVIERGWATK